MTPILCDKEGNIFVGHIIRGHIIKGENPALGTVDVVINEIKNVKVERSYDEETQSIQLNPEQF
ncbi:MAG TPA: hypothetical protein VK105_14250 [Virgibacillus sp.]|nr:hypothetical protein [Virgibacillus sp.]HLR68268.1 hypothetical protein [Virgibacillus sp.]